MADEFLDENADDSRVARLVHDLKEQQAKEAALREALREGARRFLPSALGVVRVLLVGLGLAGALVGAYAQFVAPVGMITPPLRSLALLGFGLVVFAFGVALREYRES